MLTVFRSSKKPAVRSPSGIALWSLIVLIVMELSIRSFVIRPVRMVYDSNWGAIPVEGSCGFHALEGFGKTCYAARNEVQTPFDDGIPVVVLGDSYTEAIQVGNSEKYVSLTEAALRERGLAVNLINLGDSNRTFADFVFMAPEIVSRYNPEIVVVQTNESGLFDSLNPSRTNYFAGQPGRDGLQLIHRDRKDAPLFVQNLIHSSGLLTLTALRWEQSAEVVSDPPAGQGDPPRASPAQLTEEVAQLVAAYPDAKIIILVIPSLPILFPDKLNPGWSTPNDMEVFSILAKMEDVTVLYPAPAFKEIYKEYGVFPRGFFNSRPNYGHLNRYGHIAIANALTMALELALK